MRTKVCFYTGSMSLGGIGKLTLYLIEEFLERGVEVDLFLMKGEGEYMDKLPKGVQVIIEDGSYIRRLYKFVNYLIREKPAVSISARQRQDIANILGCLFVFCKTKPVISIHTNVSVENELRTKESNRNNNWHIKVLSKLLYKIPKRFIAVSEGVADDFSYRTGVDRSNIKVIYNPVYRPYVENIVQVSQVFRELVSQGKTIIVGVGRLTHQKDFSTLIKSFSLVRQADANTVLVILGDGPLREDLEDQITELGLTQNVILLGFISNPLPYIKEASLLVLSSRWEGFGIVIVEALGVGTSVVSTDCPSGPAEILENGKYGRLVPVGDAVKMAKAIVDTIRTPYDPSFLITRAEDFSTEKIAEEYLNVIF